MKPKHCMGAYVPWTCTKCPNDERRACKVMGGKERVKPSRWTGARR